MTRTLFCLFFILGGFVALQWHDDHVERQLSQLAADAVSTYSAECAAPVVLTDSTPRSGR